MLYQDKQKLLFEEIESKFKSGQTPSSLVEKIDNYADDDRACLTGITFLPSELQTIITNKIINPLKQLDQRQYYYLPNQLHLTIQSVRTIHQPPLFNGQDVELIKKVFSEVIPRHSTIKFTLEGLFELPTSLAIRCYCSSTIQGLRHELELEMNKVGVPDNKQYASKDVFFGNITVCRYVTEPSNDFFKKVSELKNIYFGEVQVNLVSLVVTNLVAHPANTEIKGQYKLKD